MAGVRKVCEDCGQPTITERYDNTEPLEGHRTTCCDRWVCDDCVCWVETDESKTVCKECCHCKCKEDEEELSAEDFFEYDSDKEFQGIWWIRIGLGTLIIIIVLTILDILPYGPQ
jgi:hypothetical protein